MVHNLKNSLINDYDQMPRIMNKHWADNVKTKKKKSFMLKNFIAMKKFNSQMENPKSFLGLSKKKIYFQIIRIKINIIFVIL